MNLESCSRFIAFNEALDEVVSQHIRFPYIWSSYDFLPEQKQLSVQHSVRNKAVDTIKYVVYKTGEVR